MSRLWFQPFFKAIAFSFLALFLAFLNSKSAQGETGASEQKAKLESLDNVCTGYHPIKEKWGWAAFAPNEWTNCSPGHAYFGIKKPGGHFQPDAVRIFASCCKLPAADILLDQHVVSPSVCPQDYIATGAFFGKCSSDDRSTCQNPLRCTRINTEKYALGPARQGTDWGPSTASAFPWQIVKRIRRDEIPVAIRFGISRVTSTLFINSGCVGNPLGSLLTGKHSSSCKGTSWQQLFRREKIKEESNKKELLVPIKMFPSCRRLSDLLDPKAVCIK